MLRVWIQKIKSKVKDNESLRSTSRRLQLGLLIDRLLCLSDQTFALMICRELLCYYLPYINYYYIVLEYRIRLISMYAKYLPTTVA